MRKKIAALLCAIMCITAFTGCSKAELAYLKMGVDMMQTMKLCEVTGKTNVQVDYDAMKGLVTDLGKAGGLSDEETKKAVDSLSAFTGKKEIGLDYTMKMNMDDLSYVMGLKVNYGGKAYDMGQLYFSMTDMYVSGTSLWGAYELSRDILKTSQDSYMFKPEFATELKAAFDKAGYVNIYSIEAMTGTTVEQAMLPEGGFGDLYAAVYEFYQDAFKDFSTNMVTEVSGGFKVQADGQAVAKLTVALLDYMGTNADGFLAATTKYIMEVSKSMGLTEEEQAMMKTELDAMVADTASFKSAMTDLKTTVNQVIAMPVVSKVLDSFKYESTTTKQGTAFVANEVVDITNAGKSVVKITSNIKTAPGTGAITMPAKSISLETLAEDMTVLSDKHNPVTGVSVLWGFEGDNSAIMSRERAEVSFLSNDTSTTTYVVKEGRVYLPLREICEAMGETVEWNNGEKTAYIVKGTEKTPLAGVVEDGKSYVMVRDFEKIGYVVGYESTDGLKEATISKAA